MKAVVLLRAVFDASVGGGTYEGPYVLDGSSQAALGLARQWRSSAPGGRVAGVAIGPPEWEPALRNALVLGCDEVWRGWGDAMGGADVLTVAQAIAEIVPAGAALVIGGESSSDHGTGLLPAAVAENLGWPYRGEVTGVVAEGAATAFAVRREGGRRLHCRTEAAIVVAAARMPAPAFYPRVADLIAARKTGIPCVSVDGPKRDAPGIEVIGYGPAKPLTRHLLQPSAGANPAQRLKQLMSGGVTNRGAKAMGGAGDEMARKLVELLVSEGFAT